MLLKIPERPIEEPHRLLTDLQDYLQEVLGVRARVQEWDGKKQLPLHIGSSFAFKKAHLDDQEVLLVITLTNTWTPAALGKQLDLIEGMAAMPVLFVTPTMTAPARARLVAQRNAFVVPGLQLYFPQKGIAFKETFKAPLKVGPALTISTQAFVIYALLHPEQKNFQPAAMAEVLDYEPMTMTRAFNELEARHLASSRSEGRKRIFEFNDHGRDLWNRTKGLMESPVRKKQWFTNDTAIQKEHGLSAGLSALSEQTDLSPPECPVFAVAPAGWNWPGPLAARKDVLGYSQSDAIEVEFWIYPPKLFTTGPRVDHFNLYLSLRELADERVQAALSKMEKFW